MMFQILLAVAFIAWIFWILTTAPKGYSKKTKAAKSKDYFYYEDSTQN